MTPFEFYTALFSHYDKYLLILSFVCLLYAIILRNRVYSIFDPLFLAFLASAFGIADVVFLYDLKLIRSYYFISFIATQAAFLTGFFMFRPLKIPHVTKIECRTQVDSLKILFILSSFLYISAQIYSYWQKGLPILAESRLMEFYDQDFIGSILNKIITPSRIIAAALGVHFAITANRHFKYFSYLILIIFITLSLFSGAKSNYLDLIFIMFTYTLFARKYLPLNKLTGVKILLWFMSILSVIGAIIITILYYHASNPLQYLVLRLVQTGDTYFYAYPNDVIEQVTKSNIIVALFPGFAKFFGIISPNNIPSLGLELFRLVNDSTALEGPNARHNVFGLAYLGPYWSVLYSFILGTILGFVRSGLFRLLPATALSSVIYVVLFITLYGLETDANMAFGHLVGVLFFGLILIIASEVISKSIPWQPTGGAAPDGQLVSRTPGMAG
jgi:hypothetical protein